MGGTEGGATLKLRRLAETDDLGAFSCGDADLEDFLKTDARYLEGSDLTRVFVAALDGRVVGYIALLADTIELKTPEKKKMGLGGGTPNPRQFPALKVGRLAVDNAFKGQGLGTYLMRLAFDHALIIQHQVGCRLLTVDAYQKSVDFYLKLGFVANKVQATQIKAPPYKVTLPTVPIRKKPYFRRPCLHRETFGPIPVTPVPRQPTLSMRFDLRTHPAPAWTRDE
jgi:predicted N-acetyltransferase YhbS